MQAATKTNGLLSKKQHGTAKQQNDAFSRCYLSQLIGLCSIEEMLSITAKTYESVWWTVMFLIYSMTNCQRCVFGMHVFVFRLNMLAMPFLGRLQQNMILNTPKCNKSIQKCSRWLIILVESFLLHHISYKIFFNILNWSILPIQCVCTCSKVLGSVKML